MKKLLILLTFFVSLPMPLAAQQDTVTLAITEERAIDIATEFAMKNGFNMFGCSKGSSAFFVSGKWLVSFLSDDHEGDRMPLIATGCGIYVLPSGEVPLSQFSFELISLIDTSGLPAKEVVPITKEEVISIAQEYWECNTARANEESKNGCDIVAVFSEKNDGWFVQFSPLTTPDGGALPGSREFIFIDTKGEITRRI